MQTLVLKTNIELRDLPFIKQKFDALLLIDKWTIDFEDHEHILRIESHFDNLLPIVISQVKSLGLECAELV
jgi:hypothetical protein